MSAVCSVGRSFFLFVFFLVLFCSCLRTVKYILILILKMHQTEHISVTEVRHKLFSFRRGPQMKTSPEFVSVLWLRMYPVLRKSSHISQSCGLSYWSPLLGMRIMSHYLPNLILEVCELWCFPGPKTDPATVSLVKSIPFISDFCYSAFSLKSLCSLGCIYSCSWLTESVLWACGMSSCFCLWIGSHHKYAHLLNTLFNTKKSMRKALTTHLCQLVSEVYIFLLKKWKN